jgi:chorismate mutase-like protein
MGTIEDWRKKINAVDAHLLRLLNRRARLARRIGRIKRRDGKPLWSPRRERVILQRLAQLNQGPLHADAVRRIFRAILRESRGAQAAAMHPQALGPRRAR